VLLGQQQQLHSDISTETDSGIGRKVPAAPAADTAAALSGRCTRVCAHATLAVQAMSSLQVSSATTTAAAAAAAAEAEAALLQLLH
jgi:hypothetical protein